MASLMSLCVWVNASSVVRVVAGELGAAALGAAALADWSDGLSEVAGAAGAGADAVTAGAYLFSRIRRSSAANGSPLSLRNTTTRSSLSLPLGSRSISLNALAA